MAVGGICPIIALLFWIENVFYSFQHHWSGVGHLVFLRAEKRWNTRGDTCQMFAFNLFTRSWPNSNGHIPTPHPGWLRSCRRHDGTTAGQRCCRRCNLRWGCAAGVTASTHGAAFRCCGRSESRTGKREFLLIAKICQSRGVEICWEKKCLL